MNLVNQKCYYKSKSGKEYEATIIAIPENPEHGYSPLPTVSLEFRNERGKLIRKTRVLPEGSLYKTCVYRIEKL